MNVASLSRHFHNLREFLTESGASKPVLDSLDAIVTGLKPFAQDGVKDFAEFLVKAEEHRRTGVYPTAGAKRRGSDKSGTASGTPKAAVTPKLTVEEVTKRVVDLHASAASPDTTPEMIAEGLKSIDSLTAANLLIVATALNVHPGLKGKPKPFIVSTIKDAVQGVWDTSHRVKL